MKGLTKLTTIFKTNKCVDPLFHLLLSLLLDISVREVLEMYITILQRILLGKVRITCFWYKNNLAQHTMVFSLRLSLTACPS
jgi:hypothetical protein